MDAVRGTAWRLSVGLLIAAAVLTSAPAAGATPSSRLEELLPGLGGGRSATPPAQPLRTDPPVWADEFDGTSLDRTRWGYRKSGPRLDGILTPDAVSVADGILTIKTYTEGGHHYSGMISTQHLDGSPAGFEQTYGTFEARLRFNTSPGQWSAFWMQSPTIGEPVGAPEEAGVEMDIAEHRARCVTAPLPLPAQTCAGDSDISGRIQRALIWDGYAAAHKHVTSFSNPLPGLGNGTWHRFGLRWTPSGMTFYYDGEPQWTTAGAVSRRSQYLVLSSEVGEAFAGPTPLLGYGSRATSTTNMQVDWVRAWTATEQELGDVVPDVTPPSARVSGDARQKVGDSVAVTVACPDEPCRASATGTIRIPRLAGAKARTYVLVAAPARIAKGRRATLRVRLSRPARAAITRALRAQRRVVVRVGIRVDDRAGNSLPRTRRIVLRR
jgi:beta-glucanase (GH16 family)